MTQIIPPPSERVARFVDAVLKALTRCEPVALLIKRLVPAPMRQALMRPVYKDAMWHLPDRRYMESVIIPFLGERNIAKVLLVGCRRFTMHYPTMLAARGVTAWTIDIDADAEKFGVPGRHIIGDASVLDTNPTCFGFDAIVLSGVLGYGINEVGAIRRTFRGLARILTQGSILIVGWNQGLTDDIKSVPECVGFFDPLVHPTIPARKVFADSNHVYDFMLRNDRTIAPE